MPLPTIPKPPFPNVPKLPGVPRLPRSPKFPPAVQALLGLAEGLLWKMITAKPAWGIFDLSGNLILHADSVLSFDFRNESRIAGFPIQDGAFAAYNKVASPFETSVRLTKGGKEIDRTGFLNAIERLAGSLDLVSVVTPEKTYINVNIVRYDYRRESNNGANLLIVDVMLTEIRQVAAQYSTVKAAQQPSGAPPVNAGKVQPATTPQSVLKSIVKKLGLQ